MKLIALLLIVAFIVLMFAMQCVIVIAGSLLLVVKRRCSLRVAMVLATMPFIADLANLAGNPKLGEIVGWSWLVIMLALFFGGGGNGPKKRKRRWSLKEHLKLPPLLNPLPV